VKTRAQELLDELSQNEHPEGSLPARIQTFLQDVVSKNVIDLDKPYLVQATARLLNVSESAAQLRIQQMVRANALVPECVLDKAETPES